MKICGPEIMQKSWNTPKVMSSCIIRKNVQNIQVIIICIWFKKQMNWKITNI